MSDPTDAPTEPQSFTDGGIVSPPTVILLGGAKRGTPFDGIAGDLKVAWRNWAMLRCYEEHLTMAENIKRADELIKFMIADLDTIDIPEPPEVN